MDGIEHIVQARRGDRRAIPAIPSASRRISRTSSGPKPGCGDLIVGEVSKVNDDNTDNYFMEPTARFADIEEDEPIHPSRSATNTTSFCEQNDSRRGGSRTIPPRLCCIAPLRYPADARRAFSSMRSCRRRIISSGARIWAYSFLHQSRSIRIRAVRFSNSTRDVQTDDRLPPLRLPMGDGFLQRQQRLLLLRQFLQHVHRPQSSWNRPANSSFPGSAYRPVSKNRPGFERRIFARPPNGAHS